MDPSRCSFLFNQMIQPLELGNKEVTDKIESYLCNFDPNSPVPISLYILTAFEAIAADFAFSSSVNNDSSDMARTPRTSGSRRRGPRVPRESLLGAQTVIDLDVEDHQRDSLHFSFDRPSAFDTEVNVVDDREL